jgi:hypothetical protein
MIVTDLFESHQTCPKCGGPAFSDLVLAEKKDACYSKVRSRYKVWPSAYASGALVQCRKKGAANWGNKSEGVAEDDDGKDKFYYQRNNIWRVMDGDELVHKYTPDRYEVVGAKKLLSRFDDEGYDVTHVISPMGVVTYLYGKPEDEGVAEGLVGDVVVHNYTKIPIDLEPGQAQIAGWGPNDEPLYRVKGQDGKEVKTWSKRRMLTIAKEQGVAEGSLEELSTGLLQRAAQVAKDKRNKAMDPKIHNALGGGYMNPLAKHYDRVSQKLSNKAAKAGQQDAIEKIASPAVMRKMGMSGKGATEGVAEGGYGHRNPDLMSAGDYDRYQQDQMDYNKRDFKRREHEAEWEQEKAYSEKLAARDAGTWYIRINGKLLKDRQGQPYTFQGKAAANRAAATMMAKPFNAGKQFTLTTTAADRT